MAGGVFQQQDNFYADMPPQVAPYSQPDHTSSPHDEYHSEDFTSGEHSQFMDHHDSHHHQQDLYHIDNSETHFK